MGQGPSLITRRAALVGAAGLLAGCERAPEIEGGFAGMNDERGHLLRTPREWPSPAVSRRVQVVVAGGGIAGLAAARALRSRGVEDFALLELEDAAGGNSRGGALRGIACPLGAHYLPLPSDAAPQVQDLLEELGLRRRVAGRWVYDERTLCHAPQERLYIEGAWQEGLLPVAGIGASTRAQYQRFAEEVEVLRKGGLFRIPLRDPRRLAAWDGQTFATWLDARGFTDAQLRWYLDYCCRDDYGAGLARVSAAAGLHYFAARHGFRAPGSGGERGDDEGLLTWPEGNGFLARALARPLGDRTRTGRVVLRIAEHARGVDVDAWDVQAQRVERWQAQRCVVALPAFVAARVVENAPAALTTFAAQVRYAPWIVANLHLRAPPRDGDGMPLSWDNVQYGSDSLGYVVATHQSLNPAPGPTVLTWYCAPGEAARGDVLAQPWTHWRDRIVRELSVPHREIARHLTRVEVTRYGHGMAIPVPGALTRSHAAPATARLRFAHADWAGYSIFEEAFALGDAAGRAV